MTVDFAIDDLYKKALMQEKIVPVAQGEIKEIISQSPLKIKMHVEVLPKVEIDDKYKKIKLKKKKVNVTADEVKQALADIEKRFTKFEEVTDKRSKAAM
jgi:FKBP-type peptidyl-prolyl cis-trans isomerase (trigger factor)